MTETHSGGCQCGAIRYRVSAPFERPCICHCRMCQKAFGAWGAALVGVPLSGFTWTRGKPAEFRSSRIVARGFCAACGTPLYMQEDGFPEIDIAIGTLDDPDVVAPREQVGIESKLSWFDGLATLPSHSTADDRTPEDLAKLKTRQHPDHDTDRWPPA